MPDGASPHIFGTSLRQPPSSPQAEQALLGAILANNRAFDRVADFLEPEHFADPVNGLIFATARRRIQVGQLADAITLKTDLENSPVLADAGGVGYLGQLLSAMVGIVNAGEYGHSIHDTWLRRQAIEIGQGLVDEALSGDPERTGVTVTETAVEALLSLRQGAASGSDRAIRIGEAIAGVLTAAEATSKGEGTTGLSTGLPSLDAAWRGLWPGRLDIIAGRPGAGKTALALQVAEHVARCFVAEAKESGKAARTVDFFSLEMPAADIGTRALSMATGIPADDIKEGRPLRSTADADRLIRAQRAWEALPIVIHDDARLTLPQIALRARVASRRTRSGLIVVDHAGKVRRDKHRLRLPETEWLNALAGEMKDLAKVLGVPVLLLWHLSREGERRDNPRPLLGDLKYAGEGDADNVVLLWLPGRHLKPKPDRKGSTPDDKWAGIIGDWEAERERWAGKAELIFAKRRSGPESTVILGFDGAATRFSDLAAQSAFNEPPPPQGRWWEREE